LKILFLYTELAGYFTSCLHVLSPKVDEIHIVRWPINKEAPFEFAFPTNVFIYNREEYSRNALLQLAQEINPDKIICSGWIDKGYLKVCRVYKGKIPTVMSMDNHWVGTAKQYLMQIIAPLTIHRCFSHAWVPGDPQKKYALKLNFHPDQIHTGFYSADTEYFSEISKEVTPAKKEKMPKRILYVGRYIESKGIITLWNAFANAVESTQSNWELWCLGTGELYNKRKIHPGIKHFGFVQPAELANYLAQTSFFILPSTFEPWGVAVHEMAASGMPLICSDQVGAAPLFLQEGKNGFQFKAGNEIQLQKLLVKMMSLSDSEILKMGELSHALAQQITPKLWTDQVMNFSLS
jgi:glycosyltransferase involved in cell wall biosynthesis